MDLRDWFAGMALHYAAREISGAFNSEAEYLAEIAHDAYAMADAMLAERDKQ